MSLEPSLPDTGVQAAGEAVSDRIGRLVIPVNVNGRGPYRFIVDTGANRSAISQQVAAQIGLTPSGTGEVHSIGEVATAPLVDVTSIQYASLTFDAVQAPLIRGPVLAGEDGILGVDGMRGRRLILDFDNRCVEIAESARARPLRWHPVRGRLRFGHLVLVDGVISGRRINVFVDTGSDTTFANSALREALRGAVVDEGTSAEFMRAFTAGSPVLLDRRLIIPELRLGAVTVETVVAYVGDFHIFDLWGLSDEPTLLVGMDVLTQARAMAIDYGRGDVFFRVDDDERTGSRLRGASRGAARAYRNN